MRVLGRPVNDAMVRMVGSEPLVLRVDLDRVVPMSDRERRLVVDAMNVIGSRPTGWWRDRRGAMAGLVEELARYAAADRRARSRWCSTRGRFDARGTAESTCASPGAGADAADDAIVEMVAADAEPSSLVVATSDKRLAARVRMLGAETMSSGALLRELDR